MWRRDVIVARQPVSEIGGSVTYKSLRQTRPAKPAFRPKPAARVLDRREAAYDPMQPSAGT